MKAIVIRQFGGPEVMRLEEVAGPKPRPARYVIKVHSVSVNRTLDCVVRAGNYPVTIEMPHVLGVDPAGEVVEVGSGVTRFKIGDRVATISIIPVASASNAPAASKPIVSRANISACTAGAAMPTTLRFRNATPSRSPII